eukprot:TRINITY_DN3829_c0_g2_i2.p1 TRINITY_DN3829_c0_g2~~TRINITY_DN3829_c0_g2_i2.p1  ORF type:complete len:461 (+),score=143.77 TRINITY_DN3829_c0_g2_i2:458-1840(+)
MPCATTIAARNSAPQPQPQPQPHPTMALPSAPTSPPPAPSAPPPAAPAADLPAKLRWYYARLFPIELFTRWLSLGCAQKLSHREISFTLVGDIYIRWKSFGDQQQLLKELTTTAPVKIDIGAVYNHEPAQRHARQLPLSAEQKELVFDIDMTDYEHVVAHAPTAHAASPTQLCDHNWHYMALAARVIDDTLRQDFGFRNILWVYSGRRGIHCWVGDQRARQLSNEQRAALVEYVQLRFDGRHAHASFTPPLHPMLRRAKRLCEPLFKRLLQQQQLLHNAAAVTHMLQHIPNAPLRAHIAQRVAPLHGDAPRTWQRIESELAKAARHDYALRGCADALMLRYTYPRLDVNVSRELGHLLKAPFCVHPKSARVCVPFRVSDGEQWQPARMAPVLHELLAELDDGGADGAGEPRRGGARARLREAVLLFEQFVRQCEAEQLQLARRQRLSAVDARSVAQLMVN